MTRKIAAASVRPSAPAYPDLSNKVKELETQLATAKSAKPAYPDLSGNVVALENQLAAIPESMPSPPIPTSPAK